MKLFLIFSLLFSSSLFAKDLKVLSWNVFMLPKPIKLSWQKYRTKIIAEKLAQTDYDFLFLQEAFIGDFRSALKSKLATTYPHSFYLNMAKLSPRVMGSGLFVMSKHPFKVLDKEFFRACATADCGAAKGSVLVEATLASGKVAQFALTHMQAYERYGRKRISQLKQINAMLERNRRADVPQFLLGDLNIDPSEPEFAEGQTLTGMTSFDLSGDVDHTADLTNDCYKTAGDGIHNSWLDHMWTKGATAGLSRMQVKIMDFDYYGKKCFLSDHHAVEAVISLN